MHGAPIAVVAGHVAVHVAEGVHVALGQPLAVRRPLLRSATRLLLQVRGKVIVDVDITVRDIQVAQYHRRPPELGLQPGHVALKGRIPLLDAVLKSFELQQCRNMSR